jgi:transcriptional regulator with XRE-family HTH domain
MPEFSELLKSCREQARLSQRALAQVTNINQAIISRFESGDRGPSGAEQVLAIIKALELDQARADALLSSAGYWPQVYVSIGPNDPTLFTIARLLANDRVGPARKERFRRLVAILAEEYSEP